MRRIFSILSALLLATAGFVAWTFGHLEHIRAWPLVAAAVLLVGSFLPATVLSHRMHAPWLTAVNRVSGVAVGFLTFYLLAALASWAAVGGARAACAGVGEGTLATAFFGAATLVGLYALFSAHWIRVTRVTVPLPHLPSFWNGRTVALVSDLHLGNFRGAAFSRRVVARLMAFHAECILIGGDMYDGAKMDLVQAARPWAALAAPSGVYFVGGNHDDYGGRDAIFAALRGVGMRVLNNETVDLHGLELVGVHDQETHDPEEFRAVLERAGVDRGRASILLAHRPENLAVPEKAGIGLQLSGHTHQGQFWPWTLVARRVHGAFAYGLNRLGGMQVFTSSGAGTWGPPLRLGTRSEVVLIRLEGEQA